MQRLASVSIAILALAVFLTAGYVVLKKDPVPNAGQVPRGASATSATLTPSPSSPSSSASTVSLKGKVVAYLGDDWTEGAGATKKSKRFTTLVSKQLGVTQRNLGDDGTGYAKSTDSADPNNYEARVGDVAAAHPDAVVVSGGRNDVSDGQSTVESDIKSLFTALHKKLPKATIIAIEPMWGDSDKPSELSAIAASVKKNVTAVGGTYLAVADPIHGHPDWMSSNQADPNDAGYAAIAKALTTPLQKALTPTE